MAKTIPLILVVCLLFAASAAAADAKYVKLVHTDTGKVLAVAENSDEAGAKVVLAKDDGSKAQQWEFVKDGDHFKIVNRKSGKVLDVEGASEDEGGGIIQWDAKDDDFDNQRWSWEGKGKDRRLKSKSSKLVLDVGAQGAIVQKRPTIRPRANSGKLWTAKIERGKNNVNHGDHREKQSEFLFDLRGRYTGERSHFASSCSNVSFWIGYCFQSL